VESLAYLVRLRKNEARPAELLGNLDECSVQVRAAEYLPLSRDAVRKHGRHGHHHKHHGGHHEHPHAVRTENEDGVGSAS
jgi:hypothetical protein